MTTEPAEKNYKDTLNLPKTSFDMKANLAQREPAMLKHWQEQDLYKQIRQRNHPKGKWVLHDGPPYANGDIHMGHLINKVLKDIVVKFRTMEGHDSPYVPGWDCHGLPIESAIQKELGPKFRELSKEEVRNKCQAYAMKYVKLQGDSFQRLGVLGDYARPYLTLDPAYEGGVLDVFAELVKRDLVYRQKKPVHWCTHDRTALAEAELEYAKRKDHSIYALLKATKHSIAWAPTSGHTVTDVPHEIELMIWTTTPWTLPANRAVAVHPNHTYQLVRYTDANGTSHAVVLLGTRTEAVMREAGVDNFTVVAEAPGLAVASGVVYQHPLAAERNTEPVVEATYVTLDDGTGLVHTAPGHGKEDYQTGMRYGLEVYNPVLADGRYDDTVPDFLKGKSIWDANELVVEELKKRGTLFHHVMFDHDYPHCWRCRKPVIFRATEQWFVRASGSDDVPQSKIETSKSKISSPLWSAAKTFVDTVKWIPEWGKNRIDGMLDTRPDWCISRQRSWGVPIPAFFDDQGNILCSEKVVRTIAAHFRTHGATSWYTHTPAQLLGAEEWTDTWITPHGEKIDNRTSKIESSWTKSADILDVWFESGASHHAVLECTHPELGYPADMYLEGSDQHRGWFQSSLLEASGYKPVPPFKEVLTHGFVVDEKGRKMSKSEGNDIKVESALKQYGADVLRLWVSSVDYQNDIPCGPNLLAKTADAYRKIRNTMRYLLGNLYDFNAEKDAVEPQPHSIDAWMLSRVNAWAGEVYSAYDRYEFHNAFRLIYEFCNVEISAMYAKAIKDRLYCELPHSPKRRASQTVCYEVLLRLVELCAPVLVFTAEEAWAELRKLPGKNPWAPSVHIHSFQGGVLGAEPYGMLSGFLDEMKVDPTQARSPSVKAVLEFATGAMDMLSKTLAERKELPGKHWAVLMPLVEKGNKQLDELKRSVGLGNPLDAEAVIILPTVEDEVSKLIAQYGPEIEDALGVGFHRVERGETWDIKINDTRERYPSCARSWKRRPDVGSDKEYPDLSARDAAVVKALRK